MKQFFRFLSVGLFNFLLCIGTMALLHRMGVNYVVYTAIGYGAAICASFFLNLKFTFDANGKIKKRLLAFIVISLTNLLMVELIEIVMIEVLSIRHLVAILTGMSWYTLTGFFLNKHFVYSSRFIQKTV